MATTQQATQLATYDRDEVWRAVCDVIALELEALTPSDRQTAVFRIARAVVARLEAQPQRTWTGTLEGPCWVCGCGYHRHAGKALTCPPFGAS